MCVCVRSVKAATEGRTAVLHNSVVVSHAFMTSGTTVDTFLRGNLEWLGKANNWAKFAAVGSMGVVHKGHLPEAMQLLEPYLPKEGHGHVSSPFSEAGAMFALGLIHGKRSRSRGSGGNSIRLHCAVLCCCSRSVYLFCPLLVLIFVVCRMPASSFLHTIMDCNCYCHWTLLDWTVLN